MNRKVEPELLEREVPSADLGTLPAILRAEIDGQIATARAFPRSVAAFVKEARELVSLDVEMAEACIYALPRGGKTIAGPSVRFAEIVANSFGNNRCGGRVIAEEGQFIVAQGVFHDLEKNAMVTMEVKRRITKRQGKRFDEDMIGVTGNAAASIALRNAILRGVPKAYWQPIYDAARKVAVGDASTLTEDRNRALLWFQKAGATTAQVFAKLGVEGEEDIGIPEMEALVGLKNMVKDGIPVEVVFAVEESAVQSPTSAAGMADVASKLKGKGKAKGDPAAAEEAKPLQVDPDTGEVLPPELQ